VSTSIDLRRDHAWPPGGLRAADLRVNEAAAMLATCGDWPAVRAAWVILDEVDLVLGAIIADAATGDDLARRLNHVRSDLRSHVVAATDLEGVGFPVCHVADVLSRGTAAAALGLAMLSSRRR
jgi:hypothetical protein